MIDEGPRGQRPIDRMRDGAIDMQVGNDEEGRLVDMFPVGRWLYQVKQRAIYRFQLADVVDPERQNPDLQHQLQQVATVGADSEIVVRSLLTAQALVNPHHLPAEISRDDILELYVRLVSKLAAADEMASSIATAEQEAMARPRSGNPLVAALPAIRDVTERINAFLNNAGHTGQILFDICCQFFPLADMRQYGPFFDGFRNLMRARLEQDDPRLKFCNAFADFGKSIRNARNCVEHPTATNQVLISDFSIGLDNVLTPPTLQIVHTETPQPRVAAAAFLRDVADELLDFSEDLVAVLCSVKCNEQFAGMDIVIGELPEGRRRDGVRYGYLMNFQGKWMPLG